MYAILYRGPVNFGIHGEEGILELIFLGIDECVIELDGGGGSVFSVYKTPLNCAL